MSNAYTYTTTETWSRTHARYVSGKVAADLRQMQQAYDKPSDSAIDNYLVELTVLLTGGYVSEVSYGFLHNGAYVAALRYTADMNGNLRTDDRSGRIPRGSDVSRASFYSYLKYSQAWRDLPASERQRIERSLPFTRSEAPEPSVANGSWRSDKSYASAGCGLHRATVGGEW